MYVHIRTTNVAKTRHEVSKTRIRSTPFFSPFLSFLSCEENITYSHKETAKRHSRDCLYLHHLSRYSGYFGTLCHCGSNTRRYLYSRVQNFKFRIQMVRCVMFLDTWASA